MTDTTAHEAATRRLFELAARPGQLKIITSIPSDNRMEIEMGTGGFVKLEPYPLEDPRAWVWHDVVLVEPAPSKPGQFCAYSANYDRARAVIGAEHKITCDVTQGTPEALLRRLREWKLVPLPPPSDAAVLSAEPMKATVTRGRLRA
jgi:hypothetical protein